MIKKSVKRELCCGNEGVIVYRSYGFEVVILFKSLTC